MSRPKGATFAALTYDEIAKLEGISRSRVQQIEAQALRKLAALLADRGITDPSQVRP